MNCRLPRCAKEAKKENTHMSFKEQVELCWVLKVKWGLNMGGDEREGILECARK